MRNNISMLETMWAIRDIPSKYLNLHEKFILILLNSFSSSKKNDSWYSHVKLAEKASASYKTIERYTKTLEQKKYISVKRSRKGCKNESNRYSLNYDLIFETSTYSSTDRESVLEDLVRTESLSSTDCESVVVRTESLSKYKKKYKKEKEKGKTVGAACEAPPVTPIKRLDPNFDIGKFPALAKYLPKVVKGMKS